jgi:hypothetical protein
MTPDERYHGLVEEFLTHDGVEPPSGGSGESR